MIRTTPALAISARADTGMADPNGYSIAKFVAIVTGSPANGGTRAPRNKRATHAPVALLATAPLTTLFVAWPLGENVTATLPVPIAPSDVLQLFTELAMMSSAALAAT
jgi:hypothetical protein